MYRSFGIAAVGLILAVGLVGCSADESARSALSQSAGTASSAARAAGLVLGLRQQDQLLPTVEDTGLTDAADRLADEAGAVATMTASGGIGATRAAVLADIRAAQDQVASAQRAFSAGRDAGPTLDAERRELDRLARELQAASQRLERE